MDFQGEHKMKRQFQCAVFLSAVALVAGCGGKPGAPGKAQSISVSGSNTMINLGQAWAQAFGDVAGNPSVSVQGGGSGTGITALIAGSADIAEASRAMKPAEIDQAKAKGFTPKEIVVAQDGLSVIVNAANPVQKLTFAQLSDIFTGKVTDWKDVGGKPGKITIVSRDKSSGSYDFFLNQVMRNGDEKNDNIQYSASAQQQQSSQAIVQEAKTNVGAIGYVGLGYVKSPGIKAVPVAKTAAGPYVAPSTETVLNKTYPVSRPLFFYTKGEPTGAVKKFVDYVLSADGQSEVSKLEFVPIKK
jgi:phosphate transport system substrate-binding protein